MKKLISLSEKEIREIEKDWKKLPLPEVLNQYGLILPERDRESGLWVRVAYEWTREGFVPTRTAASRRRYGLPGLFDHYAMSKGHGAYAAYTLDESVITYDWFERWRNSGEGATLGRAFTNGTIDSYQALSSYMVLVPPLKEQERICLNLKRLEILREEKPYSWWRQGFIDIPKTVKEKEEEEEEAEWMRDWSDEETEKKDE